jgi:flagellar biosynthesis/type III secretory pathway M-ring protein FliF/YscJ
MMWLAMQAVEPRSWAPVAFAIAVIALLFVFRRSIVLRRRERQNTPARRLDTNVTQARSSIGEIELRERYLKYKRARMIPRDGRSLNAQDRAFLRQASARQPEREAAK